MLSDRRMRVPRYLVRVSVHNPRIVLAIWATILLLATAGVRQLDVDTSTDGVLDRNGEAWSFYQKSLSLFGGDEIIVAAIPSEIPFDPDALALVERITREISEVAGVRRVDSLSSVPLIDAAPDGALNLDPALASGIPRSADGRARFAARIAEDRIAKRTLISDDGRLMAVNILLERDVAGKFEEIVDSIREILPKRPVWLSGVPIFRTEINNRTASEVLFYVFLTIGIMSAFQYSIFRSVVAIVIPLGAGGAGSWALLAGMGLSRTPLSLTTMILPSLMLALGCANVMHVVTQAAEASDLTPLKDALDPVVLPVMLSGLTTTIGFLAISGVPIDAIQAVGSFGALGVLTVLALTLTAVPAALSLWPLPKAEAELSGWIRANLCARLVRIAAIGQKRILLAWAVVAAIAGIGVVRLSIETDATKWFPRGSSIRESYEQIRSGLSGISPMNVVVESIDGRSVTSSEAVSAIEGLTAYLASLPEVGKAISITDPLKQLNGGFVGDSADPIPSSAQLTEQYLLLLESVDQIKDLVTADRRAANVLLRVNNNGSKDLQNIAEKARTWWERNGAPGFRARATGIMYEFARAQDEISVGQIRGLVFELVAVGIVLFAIFRRVRLALITLLVNATPILVGFGTMGLLGIPLDAGTVVVANLAVGIAIDETLHLVGSFHELEPTLGTGQGALTEALEQSVPAILYTTFAIVLGFGVFAFSDFAFTRNLGTLTVIVMVLCVVADLLLLPALLILRSDRHAENCRASLGGAP